MLLVEKLVLWRCGYIGERVGEASHPGPAGVEEEAMDVTESPAVTPRQADALVADTLPPSEESLPYARTQQDTDAELDASFFGSFAGSAVTPLADLGFRGGAETPI